METEGRGKRGRFLRTGVNVTRGLNWGPRRGVPVNRIRDSESDALNSGAVGDSQLAQSDEERAKDVTISIPTTSESDDEQLDDNRPISVRPNSTENQTTSQKDESGPIPENESVVVVKNIVSQDERDSNSEDNGNTITWSKDGENIPLTTLENNSAKNDERENPSEGFVKQSTGKNP